MQNYIHETVLRDIIELLHDAKDLDTFDALASRGKSMKSLTDAAAGLVLVYPVIVSNSINIRTAQMVTKAIERKAVSLLRMIFSASQFTNSDDVHDYISKFHANLNIDSDLSPDSILDTIDKYVVRGESTGLDLLPSLHTRSILEKELKLNDGILSDSINESSIGDYTFVSTNGNIRIIQERISVGPDARYGSQAGSYYRATPNNSPPPIDVDALKKAAEEDERRVAQINQEAIDQAKKSGRERRGFKEPSKDTPVTSIKVSGKPEINNVGLGIIDLSKNLLDNDVKKSNELVETQMVVTIMHKDKDGGNTATNVIIGIKGKMHPVSSLDIVERIQNKNKDNNFFMKLIQTTTREISFFKDFLFAIEKAKIDALSVSKSRGSSSELWKVLERRAQKSKFKRLAGLKNNAMAITTLVVSQEEVEYLSKEYNINIEEPTVIRPIMEAYNLMSFIIVDESAEVAKFLFDTGQDLYEYLSFNALERETSNSDKDYKKMINLIAKGGI